VISPGRHPKKEIADALAAARDAGFEVVEIHRGHRWGKVVCPGCGSDWAVYGTPRNPGACANDIADFVKKHQRCRRSGTVLTFRSRRR
jgi:hypothetical protein